MAKNEDDAPAASDLPPAQSPVARDLRRAVAAQEKKRRRDKLLATATTVASFAIGVVAAIASGLGLFSATTSRQGITEILVAKVDKLEATTAGLEKAVAELQKVQQAKDVKAPTASEPATVLGASDEKFALLDKRLASIETVVLVSPDKALSTVLIRKDLEQLRHDQEESVRKTEADVSRVYDQAKWLFGLFFTLSLGILTLVATVALKVKGQKDS